ncbi:MAG: hypothetical protein NT007_13350 [Candidatus Kapabacteria bacterium]|nr:hypothetical protein [Candidatus Kapabacteria bacterium]
MKAYISFGFLILALALACTREGQLVDNSINEWKIVAASSDATLKLITLPTNKILSNDIYAEMNGGERLPGNISKIYQHDERLYLLIPSDFSIIVVDASPISMKKLGKIDFSGSKKIPSDICIPPNSTDAYVCHENDSTVSLVDISEIGKYKIARTIAVGLAPVAINVSQSSDQLHNLGNTIIVANRKSNTVSIIPTNYIAGDGTPHTVTKTIPVSAAPCLIGINTEGTLAIVISAGSGKFDTDPKTAMVATVIDIHTRTVKATNDIGNGDYNSSDLTPVSFDFSSQYSGFIATDKELFLYSDTYNSTTVIDGSIIKEVLQNQKRDEMLFLRNSSGLIELLVADNSTGEIKANFNLSASITFVYPL